MDEFERLIVRMLDEAYERRSRQVWCLDCDIGLLPYTDEVRRGTWWCPICGWEKVNPWGN